MYALLYLFLLFTGVSECLEVVWMFVVKVSCITMDLSILTVSGD